MNLWELEPDEWEGEMVYAVRHPSVGHWCGYLGLPEGHPWHGLDYDNIEPSPDVHGGLTYAANHKPRQESDGLWWIGFDCAHGGDYTPGSPSAWDTGAAYRTLEYVKQELLKLAKQAADAGKGQ